MPRTLYESDLVGTSHILSGISFIAVFFAIYTIISKNPILSVLFLIGLFFTISIYLITIGLHFLGLVYLIVYVGAVSILFLFILMLINVRVSELLSDNNNSAPLAILTILCFNYSINDILPYSIYLYDAFDTYNIKVLGNYVSGTMPIQMLNSTNDILVSIFHYLSYVNVNSVTSKSWDAILVTSTHVTSIGNILYTNLLILFIITSLILLLAMVGAIIITINKSKTNNEWNLVKSNKPHSYANNIESSLDIPSLIADIASHLTQYKSFIQNFNETVNANHINVITDTYDNMSLEVPNDMTNKVSEQLTKKVHILDGLIKSRQSSLTELFAKVSPFNEKVNDSELISKLTELSDNFKLLKESYKH